MLILKNTCLVQLVLVTISFILSKDIFYFFNMQLQTKYLEVANEKQRERARKSVKCTAESVKRDVQHLIEWFEKQPHLPNYRDEHVLATCLLQCKNSLEKTKNRAEKHFNAKASFPEIFSDRNPIENWFEEQQNIAMYVPLRKLTPDGYRVSILYLSDDVKTINEFPSMDNFIKINQITLELIAKMDYTRGGIIVHDGANVTMAVVKIFALHLQKMYYLQQQAVPVNYKKFYSLNMGQASEIILTIVKKVIKKKLAERIEILKKPSDLCKVLPKEILPREYGGDDLSLKELKDLWVEDIKNNYEYLQQVEKFASNLSKIPKDSRISELSGMPGSFRQISID